MSTTAPRFAFIMDPLSTVIPSKDTSLDLMRAVQELGGVVDYVPAEGLSVHDGDLYFMATEVRIVDAPHPFHTLTSMKRNSSEYHAVLMRLDPPFDQRYLLITQLLDHSAAPVINSPSGLRDVGEKIWALAYPQYSPPTLVTQTKTDYLSFLDEHKRCVINQ